MNMYPKKEDPIIIFADILAGNDTSEVIRQQEARGQKELINSCTLPHKFNYGTKENLEKFGIVFEEQADDLFTYVLLPDGWEKRSTDHPMWTILYDDQGRKRARIFYKAAFYDRDAFVLVTVRYSCYVRPVDGWDNCKDSLWYCVVTDCEEDIIWESDMIEPKPGYDEANRKSLIAWFVKEDEIESEGHNWLEKKYPNHRDPGAYWD